jgi:hypothetical protein
MRGRIDKGMEENSLYQQVNNWIYRNARPLDLARWQYHFEQGKKEAVIDALSAYQNKDGGFGYALEADAWNPNSAPIQVFQAIELLNEIGFEEKGHPLIQGILRYLGSGQDYKEGIWLTMVESNNDYPHAPWWNTSGQSSCHDRFNPSAGLAGFGLYYSERGSSLYEKCASIAKEAAEYILASDKLDMHVQRCFIAMTDFCKKAGITDLYDIDRVEGKLKILVNNTITRDTSVWADSYICKPSFFFHSRTSSFYQENKDIADYEVEFISKNRNREGVWNVTWGWGAYPEQWAISELWWKADIAIKNMLFLKNISREA